MNKAMWMVLVALMAAIAAAPVAGLAQVAGAPAENTPASMTQGQFAKLLVQRLGMHRHLSLNPSDLECVALLMQMGIYPSATLQEGWDIQATVTVIDVVRALVRALGMEGEVADPSKDEDWLAVLERIEMPVETVIDGVSGIQSVRLVLVSFLAHGLTGDPLYKNLVSSSSLVEALDVINLPAIHPPLLVDPIRPPRPKEPTPTLETPA